MVRDNGYAFFVYCLACYDLCMILGGEFPIILDFDSLASIEGGKNVGGTG